MEKGRANQGRKGILKYSKEENLNFLKFLLKSQGMTKAPPNHLYIKPLDTCPYSTAKNHFLLF